MDTNKESKPFVHSRGECRSIVPIIPRGNKVLLKLIYKNSVMGIRALAAGNEKFKQTELEKVGYEVVGMGGMVKDLEIGDKVYVTVQPEVMVTVKGNSNDLVSIIKELDKLSSKEEQELIISSTKFEVIEYGIYSEFQVSSIITD